MSFLRETMRFLICGALVVLAAVTTVWAAADPSAGRWALAGCLWALASLAVFDLLQRRHSILRNYPVVAHRAS